ncbi:protein phosphatase 2C domain-containing protein [Actinoplanes sp. CA-030573]|uniref:protein phosphatase 2C domain-containing protein n=1 Tax=Actinoplanes sp. CA-030573 TaxID=3239898 RepID=UPI003D90D8BB
MNPVVVSEPGDPAVPNEDWAAASRDTIVVLDGATARIDTGCRHGVAWYVAKLGVALMSAVAERPELSLQEALADSIRQVAGMHPECDLRHPGTPSAGVAIVRLQGDFLEYLVLADTVIVIQTERGIRVFTDDRVSNVARNERAAATALPLDSNERKAALGEMKRREQDARNRPGGFWVAAADPEAAKHAIVGSLAMQDTTAIAVLTDGAARCVTPFALITWGDVLRILDTDGPAELISQVRKIESSDPEAERWRRSKRSDDATVAYATLP